MLVAKEKEEDKEDDLEVDQFVGSSTSILQEIPACLDVAIEDVNQWLDVDTEDVGFQLFNDVEIVSQVLDKDEGDVNVEEKPEDESPTVNHSEAVCALENVFGCMKGRKNAYPQSILI